jgi:hypothetical protein
MATRWYSRVDLLPETLVFGRVTFFPVYSNELILLHSSWLIACAYWLTEPGNDFI